MSKRAKQTNLVHGGTKRSQWNEVSEAIFLTQGFVYDTAEAAEARFIQTGEDEYIYARYGNPTVAMFEERMALLEGAEDGFACASGMAAVNGALMSLLKAGDHIVSARALFGSCLYIAEDILTRYGVEVTFVDGADLDQWRAAVREDTKAVFFESMSNPVLELVDVAGVAAIAHAVGAKVIVDNVFTTPVYSKAIAQGADLVIYSTTKHVDGQGRCLGGVILGSKDHIRGVVEPYMKHTGGSMSPFNAWVQLKGMETLALRVKAQTENAEALAKRLSGHKNLNAVIYPGLPSHPQHDLAMRQIGAGGTMIALDIKGGKDAAFRFLNGLSIPILSNNLGDTRTIATHPATTTHQRLTPEQRADLNIGDGLVRLSLGIEDSADLIADMLSALENV